jgi:H+/Na+-translocating ferredoxin:NAD+ oxidoreductase subunit G
MIEIIATDREPDPPPARLILTLVLAGLISGLAIVAVFDATFDTIAENKAKELRAAVFTVLPGVTRMQALVYADNRLTPADQTEASESVIYGGYDDGQKFLGYAIPGEGPGFQDTIKLLYGYNPQSRMVVGMQVLQSLETPGLGDKIYKDAEFVGNFSRLLIDPIIKVVKKGRKNSNNQVDAITGATISSRAVVRIINEANADWLTRLPTPGSEPDMPDNKDEIENGQRR